MKLFLDKDATPKFSKVRQVPYSLNPKVKAELKRMEKCGIISKVSWLEWASPIVPVLKKNDTMKICGDFKVMIKKHLQVDQYPKMEGIFMSIGGGDKFSKIDQHSVYLQIEMKIPGLYQYNRLVFGVTSTPTIWQRTM